MNIKVLRTRIGDLAPYFVYSLLSLAILGPLLLPGYILTLDMPFTPNTDSTAQFYGLPTGQFSSFLPYSLLLDLGSGIVPAWFVQKVILFLAFFLCGLGAHRLVQSRGIGKYFAGLLYTINPFIYVRFLAGQWTLIISYALIPFAIKAFLDMLENGNKRNAIKVAVLSTLVGTLATHQFFLLLLAFFIIFLIKVVKERNLPPRTISAFKYSGIGAGVFLALNIYWLVPDLLAGGIRTEYLGQADLVLFAPGATSRILFDVASMYGFWRGGYIHVQDILPFWWLFFLFLLFLVAYGSICNLDRNNRSRWLVISFGIIGMVSFFLAVGAAANLTKPLFEWLWAHIPIIKGFRDSHKFVALLCLAYAYLGGLGLGEFAKTMKAQRKKLFKLAMMLLTIIALLTPLGYSFTFFGFYGQLRVTDYPKEWYEVNKYLNDDKDDFNVLFLPWHQYMDYGWLPNIEKRLANPARAFFDKPVIQGDNIEMPGIYTQSTNPISKYVEFLLRNRNINNLGELLAPLNVKYVILVKEADYESYDFLYEQKDLRVELQKPYITLFRNEHSTARVYAVDSVEYVQSLDEYIELSKTQDVMGHLYILDSGAKEYGGDEMEEIEFIAKSPVNYEIGITSNRHLIFTVNQDMNTDYWEYNNKKASKNLGFMPAFESSPDGGEVVYTKFYRIYLASYIISILALIFVVWYYFWGLKTKR